jgi:hypothetical protein
MWIDTRPCAIEIIEGSECKFPVGNGGFGQAKHEGVIGLMNQQFLCHDQASWNLLVHAGIMATLIVYSSAVQ